MPGNEIAIDLRAKDQMSQVLDHVTQKLGIFSKSGLSMGIAFAGINIAVQGLQQGIGMVIQFIGDGINQFRSFEMEMQKVQNALKGLDKSMGGDVKKTIEDFSIAFGQSVDALAQGMTTIVKKGFNAKESISILQSSSVLAVATFSDLSETVDAVASSLEAFNLSGKDSAYVAAILASVSQKTSVSIAEIGSIMERIAPTMQEAGVSIEEFAAVVGKLGEKGLPARMIMSELMTIIQNLEQPSADQQKIMTDMGFAYDDLTLKVYGLTGMLTVLKDRTEGNADAFRTLVGGMREANAATFIIEAGLGKQGDIYKNYFTELEGYYGDATKTAIFEEEKRKQVAEVNSRGIGEAWSGGVQQIQGAFVQLGAIATGGLPGLMKYYGTLNAAQQTINETYSQMPVDSFISGMNAIDAEINNQKGYIDQLGLRIKQYAQERDELMSQKDILTQTHQYTEALRYIPMALEDASYMSKIFDERTRALVDSIRIQRTELKKLSDANEDLSFASQKASLEMLKIQQTAAGNRGRMTREEKDRLRELEALQTDLRIKEMENDLAAQKIKREGLTAEEEELEKIKTAYSEKVYVIQDAYNREVASLQLSIDMKNLLIQSHEKAVDQAYTNIQTLIQAKLDAIDVYTKKWSEKMLAYYASITGESLAATKAQAEGQLTGKTTTGNIQGDITSGAIKNIFGTIDFGLIKKKVEEAANAPIIPRWKYQQGGLVQETAPALVHKGEFVIPKELVDFYMRKKPREMPHMQLPDMREPGLPVSRPQPVESGSCNKNVSITIHADLHKDVDVEDWGRKLGAGLSSGFMSSSSSGTTTATSRKTGATIVVPGTSITTALGLRTNRAGAGVVTLPVAQPINTKSRHRAG